MAELEHRSSTRIRSFLRGEIRHSNGSSKTECTVRDLSDGGARIEAPPSVTVPEFFDLMIPQRNLVHRARIMWRLGPELGVSFLETGAGAPPREDSPLELKMRMLELEAETAKLRAQLAEMRAAIETISKERKLA